MVISSVASTVHRLVWGAGIALILSTPAVAADPADEEIGEVVVTGSRVRGAQPVGSAVISLDRESLEAAGQTTVDRIIKEIPQNFDLGVSENSRAQSGGAGNIVYGNTVNLRGLGPYATLVLIDGHRVANNTRSIDPSVMPTLALERVEVVADGASAIYGSDAVAGVVNLIPRRTLDGVEVFGRTGFADAGSFSESAVGAAWGSVFDRGQVMLAFEHVTRDNLSGDDRAFFTADQTSRGGRDYRVTRCAPGTLRIGATSYAIPVGGVTQANATSLVAGTANRCNDLVGQDLFPEQEYNTAATTATFDLSDRVSLFADGFFSEREFLRKSAYSSATLTVPQTNAFFVRPAGFTGTSYTVDYSFINDVPQNDTSGQARNWQLTPGLRVKLAGDWQVEGLMGYGETEDEANAYYGLNNAALNAALASSNPATAFDPYGLNRTSAAVRTAVADQIFFAPTKSVFRGYELRTNGSLLSLPGGNLGVAAGLERQDIDVGLGSARGGPTTPLTFRHFERQVDSAYVEFSLPLFGTSNERAGLHRLAFNAAVRYDNYSDVGDTTNTKFGVSWAPMADLTFRGSYGTSFRAPLISQIYGNSNNLFNQNYQNPAGGAAIPGIALSGVNLDLRPEEATTWSVGADWEALDGLRLSLTYFDVNYENQVEAYLSNLALLAREADFAGTGIILRGTAARDRTLQELARGVLPVGAYPGGSPNNITLFVDGRSQNLGVSNMRGVDFQATWRLPATEAGTFGFSANGSYLTDFEVAITSSAPLADRLDTIFNPLKFKARGGVTWDRGPLQAAVMLTYVGGYTNNAVTPAEPVGSYTPVDVTFGWDLGSLGSNALLQDLKLGLEVRNAFDTDPPYVNLAPSGNGSGGYDATSSNPIGRLFAISLRKTW
jgi:iron complex outermembrane recepter protein